MTDPVLAALTSPTRLSELMGSEVTASRLRYKPGLSCAAALLQGTRPVGWVWALVPRAAVKGANARDRAERHGRGHEVREILDGSIRVMSGTLATDPRLISRLTRLNPEPGEILNYNPLRRMVFRRGDVVHRVSRTEHRDALAELTEQLEAAGVPVVRPLGSASSRRQQVSRWPWIEGQDASQAIARESADRIAVDVGRALGTLHTAGAAGWGRFTGLRPRGFDEQIAAARDSVTLLATVCPEAAGDARRALAGVERLGTSSLVGVGGDVVAHGDFSLDQCLVRPGGSVVLTDFDRACLAPPALDLASLQATLLLERRPLVFEAVLEGYRQACGAHASVPPVWVAAAVLARSVEPWRMQAEGWRAEIAWRSRLAAHLAEPQDHSRPTNPVSPGAFTDRSVAAPGRRVPRIVRSRSGDVEILVARAWPGKMRDAGMRIDVEGRDHHGRLRAGYLELDSAEDTATLLPPGEDPKLPDLAEIASHGRLVVHRAGRRAVVEQPDHYVKVLRPGRAGPVVQAVSAGARLAGDCSLVAPRVIDASDSWVRVSRVPGREVHALAEHRDWQRIWQTWARSWERFIALPPTVGGDHAPLRTHSWGDEAQLLRRWYEKGEQCGVLPDPVWRERATVLASSLDRLSAPATVVAHRDLHDKQMLWDGERLGVLDFDTLCLADPALDLTNLAVHAELRAAQGLWSPAAARVVTAAVRQVAGGAGVEDHRWHQGRRAVLTRLVAVYSYRPRWSDTVQAWAESRWTSDAWAASMAG